MKTFRFNCYLVLLFICSFLLFPKNIASQSGWSQLTSGTGSLLNIMEIVDSSVGYVGAGYGLLIRTTNGGTNWVRLETPTTSYTFRLAFFDRDTGLYLSDYKLFRTTNGGMNWDEFLNFPSYLVEIFAANRDTLYLESTGYTYPNLPTVLLFRSVDRGASWFELASYIGISNCMTFINSTTGFWNANASIQRTTNSGINWFQKSLPITYTIIPYMQFLNSNTGIVLVGRENSSRYDLYKTTDFCTSWKLMSDTSVTCSAGYFLTPDTGYRVASGNSIFMTSNGGLNWQHQVTLGSGLNKFFFLNNKTGYCIGSNGTILKTTNGGQPIGIEPISGQNPKEFSLSQNYPNPFNPSTKISFNIPVGNGRDRSVKLTIYDALGREITTLVNGQLQPGEYSVTWDASNFASGIYFYRLLAGDFNESKKMLLIK